MGDKKTRPFYTNKDIGKTVKEVRSELREVAAETRKRVVNHNDTEDQDAHTKNLREAGGSNN